MKHASTYIDQETGIEVKVFAPQEKKRNKPKKSKPRVIQQSMLEGLNAYDAAVQFDVLHIEAETPTVELETVGDQYARELRIARDKFNRRQRA